MCIAYPIEDCGLFYYVGPQRVAMPLDGVHVSVRIVDLVAEVQVVQFYGKSSFFVFLCFSSFLFTSFHYFIFLINFQVNPTGDLIDTKYTFPLDESAAVCGFEAELEDKLLIGEV